MSIVHKDEHGGNISRASRVHGIDERRIIDFSANYNPVNSMGIARTVIRNNMRRLLAYPDAAYHDLLSALALFYNIKKDNVVCGNGSIELIYVLSRILDVHKVFITVPNFIDYERAFKKSGKEILYVYGKESDGFKVHIDDLSKYMVKDSVLILSNPNNPAGYTYNKQEMEELARMALKKGCFLLVDEAFCEFTDKNDCESLLSRAPDVPGLFVLRSLTKILNIPGIRLGFCAGNRKSLAPLQKELYPWNINTFASAIGRNLHKYKNVIKKTPRIVARERECLETMLKRFDSLHYYHSGSNYILLKRIDGKPASALAEFCAKRGFLIRDCSNYTNLDYTYFRIAVKAYRENKKLIKIFKDYFKGGKR
ncbi:MAG: aminotransferase class I/II-fold pyridoxal phosphate-dependent enzyme [Spirochaetales bacterium]|nr:aminotransferase class I/II-fold pyridoxal phosphate-dependent enzyme [Spirochaetales bacterium]